MENVETKISAEGEPNKQQTYSATIWKAQKLELPGPFETGR